jgi:hypothetical protein
MAKSEELDLYGTDLTHTKLKEGYETHEAYANQGNTRVIKALMFPVHVKTSSPMFPGAEVFQERTLKRGDKVTVEELGLIALEKGERSGHFFTDEELENGVAVPGTPELVKVSSETLDDNASVSELGEHELVQWLSGESGAKAPTVPEIIEAVGEDKDLAKRVIAAENERDKDDPRATLIDKLTKVAETE